jgi:hypothetical protein
MNDLSLKIANENILFGQMYIYRHKALGEFFNCEIKAFDTVNNSIEIRITQNIIWQGTFEEFNRDFTKQTP